MVLTILELNEQRTPQYGEIRRNGQSPSGVIGVHTAENDIDLAGIDLGAENVAQYILTRSDYGSYHDLVDADSILNLVPYIAEAWGAPAINNHGYHVSAAVRAHQWHKIPKARRDNIVKNMAIAAADFAEWLEEHYGIIVPAKRINKAQAERLEPGFVAHADLDPDRRSDPGDDFDWDLFLSTFADLRGLTVGGDVKKPSKPTNPVKVPTPAKPPVSGGSGPSTPPKSLLPLTVDGVFGSNTITELQRALQKAGFYEGGYVDGRVGNFTWSGYQKFLDSTGAYRGAVDGNFGGFSVEAEQIFLKAVGMYDGPIDRDRGSNTIRALQKALNAGKLKKGVVKVEVVTGSNASFVNPTIGRITGTYGYRVHPVTGQRGNLHKGLDIANVRGTPIYAAFAGTVRATRTNSYRGDKRGNAVTGTWNTGNFVLIDGPGGGSEWYGHLHKVYVKPGQKVQVGQIIGAMGDTGNVTGVHLHVEFWAGRSTSTARDPMITFNKFGVSPGKSKPSVANNGKVSFRVISGNAPGAVKTPSKPSSTATKTKRVAGTDRYITVDGDFGEFTKIAFQQILHNRKYRGHSIDGVFGPASVRSMQNWLRAKGQRGHSVDGKWGAATTTSLQRHLRSLGYKGHAIDGKFGSATIKSLQQALVAGKVN